MLNRKTYLGQGFEELSTDKYLLAEALEADKELMGAVVAHLILEKGLSVFAQYEDGEKSKGLLRVEIGVAK